MLPKLAFFLLSLLLVSVAPAQKPVPAAETVLQTAIQKADRENKSVLVIFHASWCVWCHKLDSLINDPRDRDIFRKHFVVTHITVLENAAHKADENPGGKDLLEKYGGKNSGIPYWLVFSKTGTYLANSRNTGTTGPLTGENGDNTGCPQEEEERSYFLRVLKETAGFTNKELATVNTVFTAK